MKTGCKANVHGISHVIYHFENLEEGQRSWGTLAIVKLHLQPRDMESSSYSKYN